MKSQVGGKKSVGQLTGLQAVDAPGILYSGIVGNDIHLPKPKLSLSKRTFRYSGTLLFNSLHRNINNTISLSKMM